MLVPHHLTPYTPYLGHWLPLAITFLLNDFWEEEKKKNFIRIHEPRILIVHFVSISSAFQSRPRLVYNHGGTYARSPSPQPPPPPPPHLGNWLPLAKKTPHFPDFLRKSSQDYATKILPISPIKWEHTRGSLLHSSGSGGGGGGVSIRYIFQCIFILLTRNLNESGLNYASIVESRLSAWKISMTQRPLIIQIPNGGGGGVYRRWETSNVRVPPDSMGVGAGGWPLGIHIQISEALLQVRFLLVTSFHAHDAVGSALAADVVPGPPSQRAYDHAVLSAVGIVRFVMAPVLENVCKIITYGMD